MEGFCKILIVDDEMLVRQGIKHLLDWESEGFQIVGEASNGKEALELAGLYQPHIVLTDIVMPVMDGEELARVMKAMYPDIEIVVLSSFGEYEYVRSTFQSGAADYMLKPRLDAASLLTVLRKTAQRIPAFQRAEWTSEKKPSAAYVLDKLISGYAVEDDLLELKASFPHPCYALLIAEVQEGSGVVKRCEEWMEASIEAFIQSCGQPMITRFLTPQEHHVRVLLNIEESGRAAAVGLAEQLAAAGMKGSLPVVVALSKNFARLDELFDVYSNDILSLLDHRFFLPDRQLLIVDEFTERESKGLPFDMEAFHDELNHQEFHLAFHRLSSYVSSMPGRLDTDMFEFKSFLGHSLFNMIVSMAHFRYDVTALEERKHAYFRSVHESKHIGEVISLLESFLNEAMEIIAGSNRTGSSGIQKILLYMEEHYAEPLSLTEVANYFHFNPSYLSNYFAVHNKEGFNEYLNRVRIEKACQLLRECADLSISEIAGNVGYSDHSYFTKVFRKLKGISPSHYRKKQ